MRYNRKDITTMDAMNLIRSSAWYYHTKMKEQGFFVEYDELVGEFGIVYSKALKLHNGNGNAKFDTYLSNAFSNTIKDMKRDICRHSGKAIGFLVLEDEGWENFYDVKEAVKGIVNNSIILSELCDPSEEAKEKFAEMQARGEDVNLLDAIAEVHKLDKGQIMWQLKKAKKKYDEFKKYRLTSVTT